FNRLATRGEVRYKRPASTYSHLGTRGTMLRKYWLAVIFAVAVLSLSSPARALDDWQPINQDELKMVADAAHPYDAIILYHEEQADDMQSHSLVYKRVKILTEKGKRFADVAIPYDADDIHISGIKARTIAPDGSITVFDGKVYNSTIVKGRGIKY